MTKMLHRLLMLGLIALLAVPLYAQEAETIALGQSIEAELADGQDNALYNFEGTAGQLVSITLVSDDFDPLLVLIGPDGQELTINDDGGPGSLNSRIGPYSLPEDGEYTIVVDTYSHYYGTSTRSDGGEYVLTLAEVDFQPLEYSQTVEGELGVNEQAYFRFRGEAGDVVNVVVTSDNMSSRVSLSLDGNLLMTDDASISRDRTALIGGYTLPASGDYVVVVESTSGEGGTFQLSLEQVEVQELRLGDTVTIEFGDDHLVSYFRFDAAAGDVVSLIVEGDGSFDTTLALNAPDGFQVAYSDDSADLDPELTNQILTTAGTYTVVVQPYQPGDEGTVTLTLQRGRLSSLDRGPVVVSLSSVRTRETLVFTGVAGEDVRLIVEVLDETQAAPNIGILQGDRSLAYASGTMVNRLSFDFTVPANGDVFVQIDEYSYTDISLRITLERLSPPAAPVVTAAPTEEATPEATEAPEATVEPTGQPEVTETPEATEPAGGGEPPEETETPGNGGQPGATEEPEATEAA
ncbi:MAG: hypothetical protein DIU68_001680 [Chloroflexota bacterium]|nr:MAG: hypothetical protein DIU68_03935 [Chloroflexota bacterium]